MYWPPFVLCPGPLYYGESTLHLALMKRETAIFHYLLDCGASTIVRACGNFFLPPDWQRHFPDKEGPKCPEAVFDVAEDKAADASSKSSESDHEDGVRDERRRNEQRWRAARWREIVARFVPLDACSTVYYGEFVLSFAACTGQCGARPWNRTGGRGRL